MSKPYRVVWGGLTGQATQSADNTKELLEMRSVLEWFVSAQQSNPFDTRLECTDEFANKLATYILSEDGVNAREVCEEWGYGERQAKGLLNWARRRKGVLVLSS